MRSGKEDEASELPDVAAGVLVGPSLLVDYWITFRARDCRVYICIHGGILVTQVYRHGSFFTAHRKVNIDPIFGFCGVCGKKINQPRFLVAVSSNGQIESEINTENGWRFAIGTDCAKLFGPDVLFEMEN